MSQIRCEECPFSDIDNGVTHDRCVHPDVGGERDAAKRCRVCGELVVISTHQYIAGVAAAHSARCPKCNP